MLEKKLCPVCGSHLSSLDISKINIDYHRCNFCGSEIRINIDFGRCEDPAYYQLTDNPVHVKAHIDLLKADRIHYDTLFKTLKGPLHKRTLKKSKIESFLNNNFKKIYAFGGGLPKMESYFNPNEIIIFDKHAEYYEKVLEPIFYNYYKFRGKISYKKFHLDSNSRFHSLLAEEIKTNENLLITFIHFLEHFTPDIFFNLIDDISCFRGGNINYLIYQPNIEAARDRNWCHYHIIHNLFIPRSTMIQILKSKGFDILFEISYSDDMLIIFK